VFFLLLARRCCWGSGRRGFTCGRLSVKYGDLVARYSAQNGGTTLVLAVIHTRSRFSPGVISSGGPEGHAVTEDTFEWAKWRMKDDDAT
jgi:hypothetical protein